MTHDTVFRAAQPQAARVHTGRHRLSTLIRHRAQTSRSWRMASRSRSPRRIRRTRSFTRWISRWSPINGGRRISPRNSSRRATSRYWTTWAIRPTAAATARSASRCTLANDPATAPWGGLPKPTVLVARLTCDCIEHVFSQWARALGSEFFPLEAPAVDAQGSRVVREVEQPVGRASTSAIASSCWSPRCASSSRSSSDAPAASSTRRASRN